VTHRECAESKCLPAWDFLFVIHVLADAKNEFNVTRPLETIYPGKLRSWEVDCCRGAYKFSRGYCLNLFAPEGCFIRDPLQTRPPLPFE
jgi:hypothetical protein